MNRIAPLLALPLFLATPACFFILDDDREEEPEPTPSPEPANSAPVIDSEESFWFCDWDGQAGDYFWEFQAVVWDDDGPRDVDAVEVTIWEAGTSYFVDGFALLQEDDFMWGGLVWESESDLYCGDPVDVEIEAWDSVDHYARLLIAY